MRRQATIGEAEYDVYTDDLMEFPTDCIVAALSEIASRPRREGETAFPEIAIIVAVTKEIRAARSRARSENDSAREWEERRARAERERQEDMADPEQWEKTIADTAERLKMDRRPVEIDISPNMVECPHCFKELPISSNLRFFTSDELRQYADGLDEAKERKRLGL